MRLRRSLTAERSSRTTAPESGRRCQHRGVMKSMRLALALNKRVASLLIVSLISASCAHTTPNPVALAQVGDDTKTCDGIANEMQQMVNTQTEAAGERNKQIGGNVALGIAGAFLIVPWFFMDLGNAATVEEKAAQARYQRLAQMQADRKCPSVPAPVNAAAPTAVPAAPVAVQAAQPVQAAPAAVAPPPAQVVPAVRRVSEPTASGSAVQVGTPAAPSSGTSPAMVQATVGSPSAVASKRMFNAERFAKASGCDLPAATVNISAAAYETLTVRCSNADPMSIRCDDSSCREVR